jgi:hypothetical protein
MRRYCRASSATAFALAAVLDGADAGAPKAIA